MKNETVSPVVGMRVYYTGDCANLPGLGTISRVYSNDYGTFWDLTFDEAQRPAARGLFATMLCTGEYERFQPLESYQMRRNEQIEAFKTRFQQ